MVDSAVKDNRLAEANNLSDPCLVVNQCSANLKGSLSMEVQLEVEEGAQSLMKEHALQGLYKC